MFETKVNLVKEKIDRSDIHVFLTAFIGSCILYFTMLTTWITNPDGFWNGLWYKNGSDWENRIGRFGLTPIYMLHNYIVSPSGATFLSLFFLSLVSVLVVRLLAPDSAWKKGLILFTMIASPGVVSTLTYYYCSDGYFFAYFLSVAAVYLLVTGKSRWQWILAVVMLAYSLACYQAYITAAGALGLLWISKLCFDETKSWREIAAFVCRFVSGMVTSLLLYLSVYECIKRIFHYENSEKIVYASIGQIPRLMVQTYRLVVQYFFTNGFLYNDWAGRKYWNALFFAFAGSLVLVQISMGKGQLLRKIAGGVALFVLPMMCFGIAIIAPGANIYGETGLLMTPAISYLYLLPMILGTSYGSTKIHEKLHGFKNAVHLVLHARILLLLFSFIFAFQGYVQMHLSQRMNLSGELVAQIETVRQEKGNENLPVAFMGDMKNPGLHNSLIDPVYGTIAEYGMTWSSLEGRQASWKNFILHAVGYDYEVVSQREYEELCEMETLKDLPVFPARGSVVRLKDAIVVKLSDANLASEK